MTFAETVNLIREDVRRRLELDGRRTSLANVIGIALMPGVLCVIAYRVANFLHQKRYRIFARIIDDIQHLYTGNEIHFGAVIGPGFVLGDRRGGGISEHVTIGRNCTVLGGSTMTLNANGIDLSKGRIVLGDHCVVGIGARIIGAVTLADCTQVKHNSVVLYSAPVAGSILSGIPARMVGTAPVVAVMRWNPRQSNFLPEPDTRFRDAAKGNRS